MAHRKREREIFSWLFHSRRWDRCEREVESAFTRINEKHTCLLHLHVHHAIAYALETYAHAVKDDTSHKEIFRYF